MTAASSIDPSFLEALLRQAERLQSSATLRQVGSRRILGDLQVATLEIPTAVVLTWDNGREQAPAPGSEVILTLVVGDEVHTLRAVLVEAIQPHLRVTWPSELLETGARTRLRVAAPDQTPLEARLCQEGACREAELLHLTESGMALAVDAPFVTEVGDELLVETELPGGRLLEVACRVMQVTLPTSSSKRYQVELSFHRLLPEARETLQRFIQARRTDRSEMLRSEGPQVG